ncbi:MAG: hypothetical protein ACI9TV_001906 [Sulfurimonas sp.]|jgi:hypothetical protein|uniref:hypothetical protein n=1 Tax=Sulfurimonas sp. TaxID=2022749 RepID=UPI0039E667F7
MKYFKVISLKCIINALPTDTSYDEIIKELAFGKMIKKALEDSKNAKTISKFRH